MVEMKYNIYSKRDGWMEHKKYINQSQKGIENVRERSICHQLLAA